MELKTFGKLQHLGGIKYKKVMVIYENRNFKKGKDCSTEPGGEELENQ